MCMRTPGVTAFTTTTPPPTRGHHHCHVHDQRKVSCVTPPHPAPWLFPRRCRHRHAAAPAGIPDPGCVLADQRLPCASPTVLLQGTPADAPHARPGAHSHAATPAATFTSALHANETPPLAAPRAAALTGNLLPNLLCLLPSHVPCARWRPAAQDVPLPSAPTPGPARTHAQSPFASLRRTPRPPCARPGSAAPPADARPPAWPRCPPAA